MNWFVTALKNYVLVFLGQDSEAGASRFGANPKAGLIGRSFQAAAGGKQWSAPQAKRQT